MRRNQMKSVLALMAAGVLLLASCSKGADCDEVWQSTVTNSQLESPTQDQLSISRVFNADGSQSVKVSWPVVPGAIGYECIAKDVTNPSNVVEVFNEVVDRTSFTFPRERDTNYDISVRPIGNPKLNNQDALAATSVSHSTFVQPMPIASGDLLTSIKSVMEQYGDPEYIFQLEAGGTYRLDTELDFGGAMVTLTSADKANRPVVTFGADGVIRTYAGLTIEHINFDCSIQGSKGVVEGSSNPPSSLEGANFPGYKDKTYILQSPIIFQNCMFKNVQRCLFYTGTCAWGVEDVRVMDCIVQLNNSGSFGDAAIICTYSGTSYYKGSASWTGAVRNITLKNSTFYNIQNNTKNRVFRFLTNNLSNIFDSGYGGATIEDCTFYKTFTGKEFANNTPNRAEYTITFNNNVLKDVYRLTKFIQGNNTKSVNPATNVLWADHESVLSDGNNSKAPNYATEENPNFVGPIDQALDFSQPNGGVNFKATGAISSTVGDPRWR